jgi:1-acyl-sn-glycerol-3-phosphate acyltransferase
MLSAVRKLRDWVLTVPFLAAFGLSLVIFDLAGRLVRPFSLRGFEAVMAALQRTLMALFWICGTKVEVERSDEIESGRGYAIISNHQSMFDIAMIGGLLFTNYPKYVAKRELGRWIPSISLNLRWGGNALIDRLDRAQAVTAITEMAKTAQDRDVSVVIFPEGSRSRDGSLRRLIVLRAME